MAGRELTTTVKLMGVLDPSLQRTFDTVKKELNSLKQNRSIEDFSERWQKMGGNLQKIGQQMQNTGKSMTRKFTVPIVTGMAATGKAAGEFQYRFAKVASIVTANNG